MEKSSHNGGGAATIAAERALWSRPTQANRLLEKLRECRALGVALGLPQIQKLGIAQHTPRIFELRAAGHRIENRMKRAADGTIHSTYLLTFDAEMGR